MHTVCTLNQFKCVDDKIVELSVHEKSQKDANKVYKLPLFYNR